MRTRTFDASAGGFLKSRNGVMTSRASLSIMV
jgi:hypothetical protein